MDDKHRIIQGISTLVYPDGWEIPAEATRVHGISTEMARTYGVALAKVYDWHCRLYNAADLIVGHNVSFDNRIIRIQHKKMDYPGDEPRGKPNFCTMRKGTGMCKLPQRSGRRGPYKWPKLTELHQHLFGKEFSGAHDAMSDVTATAKCYFRMADMEKPMAMVDTEDAPAETVVQEEATGALANAPTNPPPPDKDLGWPKENAIKNESQDAPNPGADVGLGGGQ
jgi:DNA polymerase III epsilon subunit-like protein